MIDKLFQLLNVYENLEFELTIFNSTLTLIYMKFYCIIDVVYVLFDYYNFHNISIIRNFERNVFEKLSNILCIMSCPWKRNSAVSKRWRKEIVFVELYGSIPDIVFIPYYYDKRKKFMIMKRYNTYYVNYVNNTEWIIFALWRIFRFRSIREVQGV